VCASKLFEANGDVRTRRLHRCSDRRSCKNRVGISYNSLQGKQAYLTPHNSFETTLKLLRCGATVIATSRFPHDTAIRFSKEPDFGEFKARLHIFGLDFRFLKSIEAFCQYLGKTFSHVDMLVNNAAQTVRRPPAYYKSLMEVESKDVSEFSKDIQQTLLHNVKFQGWFTTKDGFNSSIINLKSFSALEGHKGNNTNAKPEVKKQGPDMLFFDSEEQIQPKVKNELAQLAESTGALDLSNYKGSISSVLSMVPLVEGDFISEEDSIKLFPKDALDEFGQQIDLREDNSWVAPIEEISITELVEDQFINACAPFILIQKMHPLFNSSPKKNRFIINVSSVEGQFNYEGKSTNHAHTNMAKVSPLY
jgi:NAD(P)-dependent dehydrogenase (short-subunit alcohol dehydrogenase family)